MQENTPTGSIPAARPLRAKNASLSSIHAGLKPIRQQALPYRGTIFLFPNGQQRRQLGEGHSRIERILRRKFRKMRRAAFKAACLQPA